MPVSLNSSSSNTTFSTHATLMHSKISSIITFCVSMHRRQPATTMQVT